MKFQKIKEKFQQMDKFSPPEITYFEKMIKPDKKLQRNSIKTYRERVSHKKKREIQLKTVR